MLVVYLAPAETSRLSFSRALALDLEWGEVIDVTTPHNLSTSLTSLPNSHHHPEDDTDQSYKLAMVLAQAAEDRKGGELLILDLREISYLTEYFIIVTGFSRTQVRALADAMKKATAEALMRHPENVEGMEETTWVVLDYGDVIAHVMTSEQREFYNLEAFWGHAGRIPLPPSSEHPVTAP